MFDILSPTKQGLFLCQQPSIKHHFRQSYQNHRLKNPKTRNLQADETPVQVLKELNRTDQQKSYLWVYRGGPPNNVGVYFTYQETRADQHAKDFLNGFKGYLQTDGYKGYVLGRRRSEHHSPSLHGTC